MNRVLEHIDFNTLYDTVSYRHPIIRRQYNHPSNQHARSILAVDEIEQKVARKL